MRNRRNEWTAVLAWFFVIVITAPFMPLAMSALRDNTSDVGPDWIGLGATLGVLVIGSWIGFRIYRRLEELGRSSLAWCALIAVAYGALLVHTPVAAEKFHILEYGFLGFLVLRAVRRGRTDSLAFVTALSVAYLLGILDETLQFYSPWVDWWELPRRNGEIQDAMTNLWSVGLAQFLVARLETTREIRSPRRADYAWATLAIALAWGTSGAFLHQLSEYGHRFEDPQVGTFFSRLDMSMLRARDENDGEKIGELLDRHRDTPYGEFVVDLYPATRDPFIHEVRVHLFRRDRYLRNRNAAIMEPGRLAEAHGFGIVAHREDEILLRYFGRTLAASGLALSAEERSWIDESDRFLGHPPYESAVSNRIITRISQRNVVWVILAGLVLVALVGHLAAGRCVEGGSR